jgi:threonine dehydratase
MSKASSLTAVPSAVDIQAAAERIAPYVSRTPVLKAPRFNHLANGDFYLKCEHLQMTGAFKARGAMNTVLVHKEEALKNGVLTHSSGNHGAALSWAAAQIGAKAHVVMPSNAPKAKIASVEYYGGIVTFVSPPLRLERRRRKKCARKLGRY